uniref:Uncharacterized protein n=1 Tax=Arundo donax TaxID=35708 RepID=A0A0A9DVW3_ARUDO
MVKYIQPLSRRWYSYFNFSIQSSRTSQCRINTIRPIRCSDQENTVTRAYLIHHF